jgi:SH3-like domain-containing protein
MPALLRALALALTLCTPAFAQTLTPFENPQSAPAKKPPVHKQVEHRHPAAKKHAPVVAAPRHGAPVRHPLRPTSAKPTLKPPPPKPVAKPVPPAVKKPAPPPVPADVGTDTGLHLPRFASLKTDEVNMRAGPGEQYPVLWQYQRRDLPIKIEREFEKWRLVEDMDGIKGWMHEATLTGHRNFVITGTADVTLRAQVNDTAEAVATLKPGVIGRLRACDAASLWCQVQVQSYQGFVRRSDIWGVLEDEAITP